MKEDSFDEFIKEGIREDVREIKLSYNVKESIKNETTRKKVSIYDRLMKFMNATIEIPISLAGAACIAILILCGSPFVITEAAKYNKDIFGYTNVKAVNIQGADIVFPNNKFGGPFNEKNKN